MIRAVVLPVGRACLRALQTSRARIGPLEKLGRAILFLPPFGLLLVLLRVRLMVMGPLVVDGLTVDGVRLRCRLPDLIQMYVYLFGVWEPDVTAFLRRRLRAGDTFIDVGANVGCFSALTSRLVGTEGAVAAIEPSPSLAPELRFNLNRCGAPNVRVIEQAVSDRAEELVLYGGPRHNLGLTATVRHRRLAPAGRVSAAPLGALATDSELTSARLIKIDVEGAEDKVLAGMIPCLDRLNPAVELLVELSPPWWSDENLRPIDVLRPFLDRGFHVYTLDNSYWPWRYLWPNDVKAPRRLRTSALLEHRMKRLDVVLSRLDQDEL